MLQMTRESCRAALHCRPCGPRKFENDEKSGFSGGCGCHDDKRNAQKQQRHTRAMTAPVQKTNTLTSRATPIDQLHTERSYQILHCEPEMWWCWMSKNGRARMAGNEGVLAPCQRYQRRLTRSWPRWHRRSGTPRSTRSPLPSRSAAPSRMGSPRCPSACRPRPLPRWRRSSKRRPDADADQPHDEATGTVAHSASDEDHLPLAPAEGLNTHAFHEAGLPGLEQLRDGHTHHPC